VGIYIGMSNLKKFEEATFDQDVLTSPGPVLVDFYADWCGPCRMMAPVIEQVAEQYGDKLKVGKLDVDAAQTIAMRYGVMGIPTLGLFQGGKMVDRLVGYPGPGGVKAFVEKNVSAAV
jgi:thioredoxin 1